MLGGARCGALPAEAPKRDARDATLLLGLPAPLTGLLMLLMGALILSRPRAWRPPFCRATRVETPTRGKNKLARRDPNSMRQTASGERSRRAGG